MAKINALISQERPQFLGITALSIGVVGLTAILYFTDELLFQRFMGDTNPILASIAIGLLGAVLLTFLLSRDWFTIYTKENLKALWQPSALAALLGILMILVDLKVIFPADMNIPFPESLLFYPAMDFLVQILFHILPLTVLLITLTSIFRKASHENIIWICVLAVALMEPAYQAVWGSSNHLSFWVTAYVALHVFLINLSELIIFKRYDFVSMYAFRLVYYLFWHIGWGYFRLNLSF